MNMDLGGLKASILKSITPSSLKAAAQKVIEQGLDHLVGAVESKLEDELDSQGEVLIEKVFCVLNDFQT